MRNAFKLPPLLLLVLLITFSGCEQNLYVETAFHDDGSVTRSITFSDTSKASPELFGIDGNNWSESFANQPESAEKVAATYSKKFDGIDRMNQEMDSADDLRFRIHTSVTSRFRWFYTYHRYADTYRSINRMAKLSQNDFFTPEDHAFIKRLPAEGKPLSKADSVYLEHLNKRIFDDYASRAYWEEVFDGLSTAMKEQPVEQKWIDSLHHRKGKLYELLLRNESDFDDDELRAIIRNVSPELDADAIIASYHNIIAPFEARLNFMTTAGTFRPVHAIRLSGTIIETNADSISGTVAFWKPPVIRFTLQDYEMHATIRKINILPVAITVGILLLTIASFARRSRKAG